MTQRKYSIAEIDRMRAVLDRSAYFPSDERIRERIVEDRLRTHLLNGTTPEELEEFSSAFTKRWEEGIRAACKPRNATNGRTNTT